MNLPPGFITIPKSPMPRARVHRLAYDVWEKQVAAGELKLTSVMERFFGQQIKSVMEVIRKLVKQSPDLFEDSGSAKLISDMAFRPREWDAELKEVAIRPLAEAMVAGYLAERALFKMRYGNAFKAAGPDEVGMAFLLNFDLPPRVRDAIREEVATSMARPWWDKINDTTRQSIEQAVKYNIDHKRGSRRIEDDIEYRLGEGSRKRAVNIARTELANATNGGHLVEARELEEAGIKVLKYWVHSADDLVRPSHIDMEHPTKSPVEGANGLFNVSGSMVPYPAHYSLPPAERCHCRCTFFADIAEPSPDQQVRLDGEPPEDTMADEEGVADAMEQTPGFEPGHKIRTEERCPDVSVASYTLRKPQTACEVARSELAKVHSKPVGKEVQRYSEEGNEAQLASMLGRGAHAVDDNAPTDVEWKTGGALHGIELKTMVDNANSKITMKADAIARKRKWEKANKGIMHTIVIDDSSVIPGKTIEEKTKAIGKFLETGDATGFDFGKRKIYYRRGYGSFRTSSMHEVKDAKELKRLIKMKKKELPEGAV